MNLGFFTMPIHPLDKDWRLSLKEDREAFVLADELGFTEAYVGEHATDKAENITSCIAFLAWIAAATKQIKLGTGTINMPNTHPAALAAIDGDARPHARRPPDFRNQPRRIAVGCRTVRQSRRQPQRDVPRSDQSGSGNLGRRAALQSARKILEHHDAKDPDRGYRPGLHRAAVAAAASADRRDGGRAVLKGRHRGRRARLGSDLGQLPDAGLGEKPLAEICRGLRARRPRRRSCQLARRQERLCRQGRGDGKSLCHRSRRSLRLLLSLAIHQAEKERPHRAVQDPPRPARRRSDAGDDLRQTDHPWHARQRRRSVAGVPGRGRPVRHAAVRRQGLEGPRAWTPVHDPDGRKGACRGSMPARAKQSSAAE